MWNKIVGFFKKAAVLVSSTFVSIFGRDAAEQFGAAALGILKSELGQITTQVVAEIQNIPNLSGNDARKEAFDRVKSRAVLSGIDAKDSITNLLIELAVNRLKENFQEV